MIACFATRSRGRFLARKAAHPSLQPLLRHCSCVPASGDNNSRSRPSVNPDGLFRLAEAKKQAVGNRSSESSRPLVVAAFLCSGGALGYAFHEGLWWPLLRDAQTAEDAATELFRESGNYSPSTAARSVTPGLFSGKDAAEWLAKGAVVVVDRVLTPAELSAVRQDLEHLASVPGALELNAKVQAGNLDTRTDRVCYIRENGASWPPYGQGLLHCHRLLRSVAAELEGRALDGALASGKRLLVPSWTQLASYGENGGFYIRHRDGYTFPSRLWYTGLFGLFLWLKMGAVRRRAITAMIYLNEADWRSEEWGGTLKCWTPTVVHLPCHRDDNFRSSCCSASAPSTAIVSPCPDECREVAPLGGRLVMFDSHAVEHEVMTTMRERWALTIWICY